jgi:hypothetical protein
MKVSNTRFHEDPFTGTRADACGRKDSQQDMAKVVLAFRDSTDAPTKQYKYDFSKILL